MNQTLKTLQTQAQQNANQKGWHVFWDKTQIKNSHDLTIGDALSLIHSEVSEAYNEYLKNDIPHLLIELADVAIRIMHLTGDLSFSLSYNFSNPFSKKEEEITLDYLHSYSKEVFHTTKKPDPKDLFLLLHLFLSESLEAYRDDNKEQFLKKILGTFLFLFYIANKFNNHCLTPYILKKMSLNLTRPPFHGRKNS